MSRVCAKVNFEREIGSKCVVYKSIDRCENGEHIQGVDSVFPLAFAVKLTGGITFDPYLVTNMTRQV